MTANIPLDTQAASGQAKGFFRQKLPEFLKAAVTWPARLSVPAKAAWCVGLFLAALAFAVWLVLRSDPKHVSLYHVLTAGRIGLVLALLVAIPVVVYSGLKLWLEGEMSQYPEIDYAWKAGIDALKSSGLALDSIPLFLVLGAANEQQERAVADASGRSFRVYGVPEGPAALHWYANPTAIYLFSPQVGVLGTLASRIDQLAQQQESEEDSVHGRGGPQLARGAGSRTISLDQFTAGEDFNQEDFAAGGGRTMAFDQPLRPAAGAAVKRRSSMLSRMLSSSAGDQPALLPANEVAEQTRRLAYLAQLLRKSRAPLCGVNGVLTLLPFHTMEAGPAEAEELEKAVKTDQATLQKTLRLRYPVTAMVVGLESERGFSELIRRVGRERASAQRFGRGFNLRSRATAEELAAFSAHVCGAFEDWVYTLFREQGALTRPGNTLLYSLLCKVRCNMKDRLTDILAAGYGADTDRRSNEAPILFSGCYFAATGPTDDRQAFVRAVFDKLDEEQEEVEWTAEAVAEDRRHRRAALAGFVVSGALALVLVGMVIARSL
jgi:hypothetical protein